MQIETPVASLNRVGKTVEQRLRHLGVETVRDLLFYFPFRYEDFSQVVAIKDLRDGEQVTVKGKVELIGNKRSPRQRKIITEAVVSDGAGQLRVIWFGQPFIAKILRVGDTVYLSGAVKSDMFGRQMVGPAYERAAQNSTTHTARIVPMYSLTTGLTQKQIRFLIKQVMPLAPQVADWLPRVMRNKAEVRPLAQAMRAIHFPENAQDLRSAERRLKFDELFILQLRAEMIRQSLTRAVAPSLKFHESETKSLVNSLPFKLTKDQKVAAWEILQDIERAMPMNRLLEGDVGSGKTVVAALALYNCVLNGGQGVMLAPTEILARQHYDSLRYLFKDAGDVTIALLTRSQQVINDREIKKRAKREIAESIGRGHTHLIVGTHALLSEAVRFKNLGLVVVDEQQRFGVEQRKLIREKSGGQPTPHFLSMSATPIPRSFALTLYGDLDLSIIKEMPPGRKPVQTRLVEPRHRERAYAFTRAQVKKGRQVFVVCPLIEANQDSRVTADGGVEKKSVLQEYDKLSQQVFPDLKICYLHGRMKAKEKEEAMAQFAAGAIDILISTAVVEVGVDVPNASLMMIEGAERFGLAQLHQFRGRVGRSSHQSYCFLFTETETANVRERLTFFEKNTDGFKLAEYDLERRGPGEVYGTAQSGMMNFKLASLRDVPLIKLARELARGVDFAQYPELKAKVKEWEESVHLE